MKKVLQISVTNEIWGLQAVGQVGRLHQPVPQESGVLTAGCGGTRPHFEESRAFHHASCKTRAGWTGRLIVQ